MDRHLVHVYIRTISTNTAHPRAQENPLRFVVEKDREMSVFNAHIEIARDNLLVHICTCDMETDDCVPSVLIWNWTTAELILDTSNVSVDLPNMSPWPEFGLLDSTFCYIISLDECGALWLCKLLPSCDPPIVHIATLHFPPTTPETEVYKIIAHAGPLEAHAPPNTPFMVNDDDRLHMFTMSYSNPSLDYRDNRGMLTLYVHQRVFSKYASSERYSGTPIDIPWAEWGPQNTRVVYPASFVPQVYEWTRFVHGQRVIFSPSPTSDIVHVLDFSLAAVLTATGALPTTSLPTSTESPMAMGFSLLPEEEIEDTVPLFLDGIVTRLPCVLIRRTLWRRYPAYMVYADGVIGVSGGLSLDVYND
ncbi:hypothetical protein BDN70DRAFT_937775 [Pholiota conissans]|uniref:Uncharacterized protein n=1 Tax=Pholiota conissans TaxID=109636 RepID=A0A9P6CN22_9AGAR|nr:hypothetical protein BDN70DRAFT_937775 [Pholiota conissans]